MKWLLVLCFIPTVLLAQEDTSLVVSFGGPEPEFVGGNEALVQFIQEHTNYPEEALEQEVAGTVIVTCLIARDGSLSDVEVYRSVHPLLDAESLRVVALMPNWMPFNGEDENTVLRAMIPFRFTLSDEIE